VNLALERSNREVHNQAESIALRHTQPLPLRPGSGSEELALPYPIQKPLLWAKKELCDIADTSPSFPLLQNNDSTDPPDQEENTKSNRLGKKISSSTLLYNADKEAEKSDLKMPES
jgi:hypothetical protein